LYEQKLPLAVGVVAFDIAGGNVFFSGGFGTTQDEFLLLGDIGGFLSHNATAGNYAGPTDIDPGPGVAFLPLATASLIRVDMADGNDLADASAISTAAVTMFGGQGDDQLIGTNAPTPLGDRLEGGTGDDVLVGLAGNDVILGGSGRDQIEGGLGNDILEGGDDTDVIVTGTGVDEVDAGSGADVLEFAAAAGNFNLSRFGANVGVFAAGDGSSTGAFGAANVETLLITSLGIGASNFVIPDLTGTTVSHVGIDLATGLKPASQIFIDGTESTDEITIADELVFPFVTPVVSLGWGKVAFVGAATTSLQVDGLGGNDSVAASQSVSLNGTSLVLLGSAGNDQLSGDATLVGGPGDDMLIGGVGNNLVFGNDGDDTMVGGPGNDTYDGGAGFDTILIEGTPSNDRIDVNQASATSLVYTVTDQFGNSATENDTLVLSGDTRTVEQATIGAGDGNDIIRATWADVLSIDGDENSLRINVHGEGATTQDRLAVVDSGLGDLVLYRKAFDQTSGSVTIGPVLFESLEIVFDGIEFLQPLAAAGGRLVVFKPDPYESNNNRLNATQLGAAPTINIDPTIDPGGDAAFNLPGDEDWYKFEAHATGTIDVRVFFEHISTVPSGRLGLPAGGDIDIAVFDASGDSIATSTSVNNDERVRIPVVEGQSYFLQVLGFSNAINTYSISIINEPAPTPVNLEIDDTVEEGDTVGAATLTTFNGSANLSSAPGFYTGKVITFTSPTNPLALERAVIANYIGGASRSFVLATPLSSAPIAGTHFQIESIDTGRSQFDNHTRDQTPTIFFRLDDGALLHDIQGNTPPVGPNNPPDRVISINFQAGPAPNAPGYAIAIFDEGATNPNSTPPGPAPTAPQTPLGFATKVPGLDGVYAFTTPVLGPGSHFLTARVQMIDPSTPMQRGFGARSLPVEVVIDVAAPPVFFGLPTVANDGLDAASDTGTILQPDTFTDRITSDNTPTFFGTAEADAIIRLYADKNGNSVLDSGDVLIGQSVASPIDGTNQLPGGRWTVTSNTSLNDPLHFTTRDGLRRIFVTAEDLAGNESVVNAASTLNIFVDSTGPRVEDVFITDNPLTVDDESLYALFDPKASTDGPTPLVNQIDIVFLDAPVRGPAGQFVYPAVNTLVAETIGNYELIGDHTGRALITQADVVSTSYDADGVRTTVRLTLNSYLPDDRFTLKVSDNIVDDAGNRLDGDTQATAPFEEALQQLLLFPSGDGQPGGPFAARFTVDSRPEIGSYAGARVNVDINGNFVWDLEGQDNDSTNRDLQFTLGVVPGFGVASMGIHDAVFNGDFHSPGLAASGFDKLAAYGFDETANAFRWLIDVNHDGIVDPLNGDVVSIQPFGYQINGIPFAGNWDPTTDGDEIGLYDGDYFYLDRDGNNVINGNDLPRIPAAANFRGLPLAGDFDGDGSDDLAVWKTDVFSFSFAPTGGLPNGTPETTIAWGYPGVAEKPVAADMDQDGIDDIGLFVPGANGHDSAWYFLISNDFAGLKRVTGTVNTLDHQFSPAPLGQDLSARFGSATELPLVGNFDPPVTSGASEASLGVVHSSKELSIPSLSGARSFGFQTTRPGALVIDLGAASAATGLTVQVYDESMTLIASGIADSQGKVHLEAARSGATNGTIRLVGTASDVNIRMQNQVAEDDLLDVNRDGFVSAIDLVTLVSSLNSSGLQSLTKSDIGQAGVFLDTNQDGYISAIDLLTVAERLNRQPSSTHALATPSTESDSAILSSEDATDLAIASSLPTPTPDSESAPVTAVQPPTATATDVAMSDAFEFSTEMKEKLASYPYSSIEASETHTFLFTLDFDWL